LTKEGYCPEHRPLRPQKKQSAEWHWMYLTPVWLKDLRPTQLLKEPFCRACAERGVRTRATVVDHIVDHEGDWSRFTDRENLQSLCESCHNRKTVQSLAQRRRKTGRL